MDINGVSSYTASTAVSTATKSDTQAVQEKQNDATAVVYEKSDSKPVDSTKKTYTANTELVNKLKSDAQERANQLENLVKTLITKQGNAYANANIFTSDFWKQFSADGKTVDEAAVKQAQQDVSEDGYWGKNQTSSRIIDFAKALSGGDPDKIDQLEKAFEKGYKQATSAWGDELPSLCKDTFDAVKEGFQQWREQSKTDNASA